MDTDTAWNLWGLRDPYYGVLSEPRFRAAVLTNESKEKFFASGRGDVANVLALCQRCVGHPYSPGRILDFGCGVGRMIIPFAEVAIEVVGIDVATAMLDEARKNCAEFGLTNVSLKLSDDLLSGVDGFFDLVHSSIVLQHLDISRGRSLFEQLIKKVRPGGCGSIHVTFAWTAHAESFGQPPGPLTIEKHSTISLVKAIWRRFTERVLLINPREAIENEITSDDPEMRMNFYNLSELMFIVQKSEISRVFMDFTNHGGALGAHIVFQRQGSGETTVR